MVQHAGKLPSTAELERYIKEKEPLCFWTLDGKERKGILRWFDENCFSIETDEKQGPKQVTLLKHAVLGYGPSKNN